MQPKIQLPINGCSNVDELIGAPITEDWKVLEDENSIYNCEAEGTQPIPSIRFGGIGISRIKNNKFNRAPKGLIYIKNSNFVCTMAAIEAAGVASNPAQVINFQGTGSHTITGTQFLYCGIYPWDQVHVEGLILNSDNWDPSLILIDGSSANIFSNVHFKIFKEGNPQGWELVPTRPIKIVGDCSLNLTSCEFFNSTALQGGFVWTGTTNNVFISYCNFEECFATDRGLGHAIYSSYNSTSVIIQYCKFLDCGKNFTGYAVMAEVSGFTFFNNTIIFSTETNSSGGLQCWAKGQYNITNNYFTKIKQKAASFGGVIDYYGDENQYKKPENIVFDGNTFDCIYGENDGRCFAAHIKEGQFTVLKRNFIHNCPSGSFFVKIMHSTQVDDFQIIGWEFKNNTVSNQNGGGAGIWIENAHISTSYNLTLQSCKFENNICSRKGGAFQTGNNRYINNIFVKIIECVFINNTAQEGGGAVAIQTLHPLEIRNCNFTQNKSPNSGGAIYIQTEIDQDGHMPSATIIDCEFRSNSGKEAHCIYIVDAPNTIIDISNCKFYNNYDENYDSGSCILSNSFKLTVTTCEFINDDLEHGSGGINVTSTCLLDISYCNFIHCTAGNLERSYGGGIGYAKVYGTDREESISIKNCNFNGNGGLNGVAIGLKPEKTYPEISNIEIKNHVLTNWIFFIFFQFETDGDFELNEVDFIGNSFDSEHYNEFGGGTGIWIAESEDINYHNAFNLVFNTCTFKDNYSPENGGAFSYGGSPRLESIGVTFKNCNFDNNQCEHYFGGAIRFETNKPASLIQCTFTNNRAKKQSVTGGSGGGAVFIGSDVESILIDDCTFENCFAYRGSFIFTNGALDDINISKCTFQNLEEGQDNSVYIEVDSQITRFVFDSNTFKNLHCDGPDGGAGLHVFNGADCTISNCKFENCRAPISDSGVIRISENVSTNSLLIFTLCEFNNQEGSGEDSARPIYIARNSLVQFNSCTFLNYNQDTQREGTILYSNSESSTVFYNCSFSSLKGKCLMHMNKAQDVDVLDCQFTNCQVTRSLIFADEAINFIVSNNLFSNDNDPIRFGEKVRFSLISNNTFEECSTNQGSGGGALYINGDDLKIEIKDNNFTKCTAQEGLAIYFDGGVLNSDIHDCKFENNYKEDSNAYTIYTKSQALNFTDCTILYDANYQGCGINIAAPCAAIITNIQFRNLHRPSAIKYNLGNGQTTSLQTSITNCLFTGFIPRGSTSNGVQYSTFEFGPNLQIQFENNTIENQISDGRSNLLIGLIDKEIRNCSFINNEVIGPRGGGSGLDMTGSEVKVIDCIFRENHALYKEGGIGGTGGAFQFGKHIASLEIDSCTFINNRADLEGGAIAVQCTSSYIHDSRFENNLASQQNFGNSTINYKMGGAVYLNNPQGSNTNTYTLSNCYFIKNTASSNGHALYIEGSNTYAYVCDLCTFEDNSRNNLGSQIFIDKNAHLDFSNSTVCLKDATTKSRGIELLNGELDAHDTTFTNIEAPKENSLTEGNAILVSRGAENVANIHDNLFKDCYLTERLSYAVTFNGIELNFERNTFDFSSSKGCGCLRIYTTGNINVENNIFQNAYLPNAGFHGVFIYEEKERITTNKHTVIKFNTFQGCSASQTACFQFKWISNDYEFIDNTFQNNDLLNYLGEFDFMGKKINGEFYCGRNKFINNTARSLYGGGAGLWFQNKEKEILLENHFTVILDGCQFIGNHAVSSQSDTRGYKNGNGGAIQFGWTESVSNIDVEIRDSTFINNIADRQGGALSIEIVGYTAIDNCTFNGNKAGNKNVDEGQILGGAIHAWFDFPYANGHFTTQNNNSWLYSENITITNSEFISNQAKDATAIYIQSSSHTNLYVVDTNFSENINPAYSNYSIVSEAKEFVFERSKIEFADRAYASSGIRTSSLTKITDSRFTKTCVFNSDMAEALLAESETDGIEISDTIFEECGKGGNRYVSLKINTPEVLIHNCVFNFNENNVDLSCLPVFIKKYSTVSFVGNKITNSRCDGAFKYEPTNGNKNNENVEIRKCTFEKVQGQNSRALYVKLITPNIAFTNNTIQDCVPLSNTHGYLFVFYIQSSGITEFVVDNIIFRNLVTESLFGGGCGCWVQHNVKYTLTFKDCIFENNHAKYSQQKDGCHNGKGGAIQYGFSASISNVDIKLDGCEFKQNIADEEGGALCLMIQGNIEISECKFINNRAGFNDEHQYGGAISIVPEYELGNHLVTESIIIDGCTFTGNGAPDANAIYVNRAPQTDLIINNNCKFLDNTNVTSNHATVMAETRKLEVDDSIFDFTSLTKTCNAITTNATTVVLDNTRFHHCLVNQKQGSALLLKTGIKTCKINNCHFIDNGNGNKGSVVYTEASSFEFTDSEIGFTTLSASDRGIYVPFICKFYLYNSYLYHCQINDNNVNYGATIYYPGERRTAHTEDISLENVHFYNNSCNYASVFYMRPTTIPKLKNLTVQDHLRGNFGIVIIFQAKVTDDILVEKCNFINNYRDQSSEYKPDCGGSGLWIACANQSTGYLEAYRIIFSQCTFKENRNNYCGGAFAYGYSPTLRYIFLDFNECTFENNTCDGQMGGALAFNSQVPVTLTKSIFRGNKCNSENYRGHCIYIHQRCKATINDCTFVDNGIFGHNENNQDASGHSIIQCSGARLDLNRCNITFTDPTVLNSRCVDINYHSIVNLINSTFSNVNVGNLWGGALYFNEAEKSIVDEQITIDSCVFDNNYAANGCSALFWATSAPTLINLTFENQPNSKYIFCIFFKEFRDTCTVENTFFENCTAASEDGGGSSIWIANMEEISHGRPFDLIFHNCTWKNNEANKKGGAIHYGTSKTLVGVQMTFDKCHFFNNHAKEEGGAVSLVTKSPIVFSDCIFRNNYVESAARASSGGTKGGSISINSKTPLVQVSGCSFTNETADDGNAIFIHNNVQACLISGCTFNNCGKKGTSIVSETIELMLLNSEISFNRRDQSCRGLEIRTISVTTVSQCTFHNCHTTENGAGIYLNNTLESEEQEDFTLEGCIFDACLADEDGCAIFLNVNSAPVLRGVTFQNHRFDKNVSVILNNNDFQDLFSIQSCKFINNQFQNTFIQDGGGCAMFIANTQTSLESLYKLSFEDCTWSKNSAAYGGAFSYGNKALVQNIEHVFERCVFDSNLASNDKGGALYLYSTQLILFDGCTFTNNRCYNPDSQNDKQGGAIYIIKCSSVSVTQTTFTDNYASDGHAIYIDDLLPTASIFGCTFDSNNNNNREGSQIASRCAELVIYDSTIKFDTKKVPCRGVQIFKQCASTFANCKFLNCKVNNEGGALRIIQDTETNRTESLTLDGCLFDDCDSSNGAVINAWISCNPTIRGCTISNCNQGHYAFCIFFVTVPTVPRFVSIDDCTFENNKFNGASTSDAGGIGFWIAYQQDLSVETLSLTFNRCDFISNFCGKNGGAFAYGESKTLKNVTLTFDTCKFNNNTSNEGKGGALYISTEKPVTITNCHFINNKCNGANTRGSAIYINSPSEKVQISESTFEGGQSIDGVAIYSDSLTNNLIVSNSRFNNCASSSTGSVIHSTAKVFNLQDSNITFDLEANVKCRGTYLQNKANAIFSNVQYINCQSSENGGGLKIDFQNGNNDELLVIKDVTIQNAVARNGCAMMVNTNKAPTLDGINIKDCTSGNYIMVIFFTTYVYEAKLSRCVFQNNQFANNGFPANPDGGGSGIWVANSGLRDDDKNKRLIFDDCHWIGNSVKASSSLKYGGAFALGTSLTTRKTELTFTSCRFIQNSAAERGGSLYLCTSLPVKISRCLFDGNEAANGAGIYLETTSNVTIEYSQIVRNKASQNGAAFIKSSQHLQMINATFTENTGPVATSLYLENEGIANIEKCGFDFSRSQNQYQIRLHGDSSSASITFRNGCFVHSGDNNGNTHIYSTHKGAVNLPAGNCFDTSQNIAINNQGGSINAESGIFDCNQCGNIYVPTIAPYPTASLPYDATVTPEIPTQAPTTSSGQSDSSSKKNKAKKIAMIAGISAAAVVLIIVIIILIWLFVCRKRSAADNNSDNNASEMNDEQITEISGIDPGADDPIWAGTNQDNPLFNGGDDQDEDQMIHNDFEESWGDSVI